MRAASGGENLSRALARRFCHPTQDYQDDADALEFDVCGHCAICIQPDSPARSNEERDIQFWPRDRVVNSRSFFADVPDVVRLNFRLCLLSFRSFPVDQREVNLFHCARGELF